MLIAGIYSLATYKERRSTVLNILSIIIGLSTSIPMAATAILAPLSLEGIKRVALIIAVIGLIVVLATISIKNNLLVRYSRINIWMFIITSIALFTTITTFDNSMVDASKILPFQGMLNAEPWKEWLTNPYWWYFEATVVSWSVFCGRFVAYCSIARETDKVFYTLAGPEISVATTKAYSAQLVAMYCLAVEFAKVREKITEEQYSYYISELLTIPEKMQKVLEDKERIQWFAAKYANAHDVFFVGRGIDYAICLEGSLKLKEISYIHSETYAAGELKHGTISLIEQGTLVIGVLTQSELYEKTISNMLECKSRGAYLMGLTTYGKYETEDQVNFTVYVPKVDEHFIGSLAVIPLQLLGYYVSVAKGLDVDKPRNLAKSVTVE